MKDQQKSSMPQDRKKILFVGANEQIAKLAPTKGLEPPVFLTDIYPGFFCLQSHNGSKCGIISVNQEVLIPDMFAPFHFYIKSKDKDEVLKNIKDYKTRWKKSLQECGVCIYTGPIQSFAIEKIVTYSPTANDYLTKFITEQPNPCEVSAKDHKYNYNSNLAIARWLNGEDIKAEDILDKKLNHKTFCELSDKLANRSGLDLYYQRSEKEKRK